MALSKAQRRLVHIRAEGCCEYCLLSVKSGTVPFHVDHVIPLKHHGSDEIDNLCFSCFNCNAHKSHDLTGFDPNTGKITRLFNPRQQIWSDHFAIEDNMVIRGLTSVGRTTVDVLQMNMEQRIESRQVLAEISEYPCKILQ